MAECCRLEQLLQTSRPASQPVGYCGSKLMTWKDWLESVRNWQGTFLSRPEQVWALYHSDALEFSVRLFGLWAAGKKICLPGHTQPAFIEQAALVAEAFTGEFGERDCLNVPNMAVPASDQPLPVLQDAELFVFTSGSSGTPKAIHKHLSQLSSEVEHLHQLWGRQCSGLSVRGTVIHQHIYGLLFRVLWPLCEGWSIRADTCEYVEDLWKHEALDCPSLLISSPSHLSRLPLVINSKYAKSLKHIFSSGAPLAKEASLDAKAKFGLPVTEVFGSSETGGIAHRQQQAEGDVGWTPMPGVEVELDDEAACLRVRSAHLPTEDEWYQTADKARFDSSGRFWLEGRADRIVKVEGKRISLDEMEQCLCRTPWVQEACLLMLEGKGSRLGAVVALSAAGQSMLETHGRRPVNQLLTDALLTQFERPTLPRKWRYPSVIPVNAQGKRLRTLLLELF